jgi:hypothetical protein
VPHRSPGEEVARVVHKDDGEGGVSADGENNFTVDQSFLDELLSNPEALATQIRAVRTRDRTETSTATACRGSGRARPSSRSA